MASGASGSWPSPRSSGASSAGGGNGNDSGNGGGNEASLDRVLSSPESRVEFVVLIMMSMDQQQQQIVNAFDPSLTSDAIYSFDKPPIKTTSQTTTKYPAPWKTDLLDTDPLGALDESASPAGAGSGAGSGAGEPPPPPPTYRQATRKLNHEDYLRRQREVRDREVSELRSDALADFGRWRVQVLRRVAEVLKVRSDVAKAAKAKRQANESGASETTEQQSLIDLDDDMDSNSKAEQSRTARLKAPKTPLGSIPEDSRVLLLNSLLLLLLSLERYSAYSRMLLVIIADALEVPVTTLNAKEDTIAHGLLAGAQQQMSAEDAKKRDNNRNAASKAWKVGLATVAGAAVIGLTGGLAAPVIAGAMGGVLGGIGLGGTAIAGLLGGLAGNFVLVGGLFGAYGGSMTGKMMEKYAREVEDFEFVPLRKVEQDQHRLRVAIGITGWLSEQREVYLPWLVLGDQIEGFVLQWEVQVLQDLGGSLLALFKEFAVKYAAIEIVKRTVFSGLLIALWPLGLLRIGKALSNSFSVAQARADRAGEVLADALIHKAQGERPVTLIGYSLGARVIFSCLQSLAKRRAFGLIETVILVGTPVTAESLRWRTVRSVVADRVVNVYSQSDYVLGLVFRTSSITPEVAGLQPVSEVAGVENYDVSDLVSGHLRYRYVVGQILQRIGYEALDANQVVREKESLAKLDESEAKMKREAQEKRKKAEESTKKGKSTGNRQDDWDDILWQGTDTDIAELNNNDIEERLKSLKLQEEEEEQRKRTVTAPQASDSANPRKNATASTLVKDGHDNLQTGRLHERGFDEKADLARRRDSEASRTAIPLEPGPKAHIDRQHRQLPSRDRSSTEGLKELSPRIQPAKGERTFGTAETNESDDEHSEEDEPHRITMIDND